MNKKLNNLKIKLASNEGGYFLITAVVMILFLTAIALSIANVVDVQYQDTAHESYTQNAELSAEAGIEQTVNALNANNSFAGYPTAQTFFDDTTQGKSTFITTITANADGSKTILSTANVYPNDSATVPAATRKVQAIVVGTGSTGYSVYTGPGGLILSGNSNITNSSVYVGGTLTLSGSSTIGTSSTPVSVDVANDSCPSGSNPGPTYPQVCTGTQPISLSGKSNIYGSVCATGQTSTGPNNNIQSGNGGQGLETGCTAPVSSPPTYDRSSQISAVAITASGSSGIYACSGSNKNINWPANLELTGNVQINSNCNVTINGNVYITGTLTVSGSAQITVANSAGTNRPVVMVDGTISVNGSSSMIANTSGVGIQYISFDNSTGDPNATPTGSNLYASQQIQSISVSGSVNLPGMIFDAYWSEVSLSGTGNLGAAEGQTVALSGTGTVVFGTQLASGSQTWKITSYKPVY